MTQWAALVSDAPASEQAWIERLFGAAGRARQAPRITNVIDVYAAICRRAVRDPGDRASVARIVLEMLEEARDRVGSRTRRAHRAGDDARALWEVMVELEATADARAER